MEEIFAWLIAYVTSPKETRAYGGHKHSVTSTYDSIGPIPRLT